MAFKNKEIHNPKTRQSFKFLQTGKDTNGTLLELESTFGANSVEPVAHYHPYQVEGFIVLEGELTVRLDGKERILKRGDHLHIPVNTVHSMWNRSATRTVVNWKVVPALDTEYLLETTTGLARDGKANESGIPSILQIAPLMTKFSDVFRLAKPPFSVQRILFAIILPVSFLFGYKATYKHHLD